MNKQNFIMQIVFNFAMALIFIWFTITSVSQNGWGFFPILSSFFATNDIVRGSKLLQIYIKIKNDNKHD